MRVALVCPYDVTVPGGVQAHVRDLAAELERHGEEVLVVAPGAPAGGVAGEGVAGEGVVRIGRSFQVPFNRSIAPIALSPLAARRELQALRRYRPDVVHIHEPGVPVLSLTAALRGPPPLVGTFHAWSERDRAYRLARPILRRAALGLDARIAVSQAALQFHARVLRLPAGSFREIPNGVHVERFASGKPLPELVQRDVPTLLFVGRLERRKGLEVLLRAFVQLKTRRPSLRLVVVGNGPDRDRCQAVLPARLQNDVQFVGQVDREELPRFHASADVFVAPNLGGESFGVVLIEAMAAGMPVVASAIPGFQAIISDGVQGRLVPPGDARALANGLDALVENPSLRQAMAGQGRETARSYDWSVVAAEIREVYDQVVTGRAG